MSQEAKELKVNDSSYPIYVTVRNDNPVMPPAFLVFSVMVFSNMASHEKYSTWRRIRNIENDVT